MTPARSTTPKIPIPILAAGPALMFSSSGDVRTVAKFASLDGVPVVDIIHLLSVRISNRTRATLGRQTAECLPQPLVPRLPCATVERLFMGASGCGLGAT